MNKHLAELESKNKDNQIWGNYDHLYDWTWTDRPVLIPILSDNTKQKKRDLPISLDVTAGVMVRDWVVAKKLKDLGIKSVLDVGSDTGHFMAVLAYYGIEAVGIDTSKKACDLIKSKGHNICYNIGIQSLITKPLTDFDCITCMNITNAKWQDEELKTNFIRWIEINFKYAVLSDVTHQDRKWFGLQCVHDFNFLPIYCSPIVTKITRYCRIEKIINYTCIQKLYAKK